MHILYLDEAGTHTGARYFVVAGLSLFERQTYYLAEELSRLQASYFPEEAEPVEFHASALRAPDEHARLPYSTVKRPQRFELLDAIGETIVRAQPRLFGIAMEKEYIASTSDEPYEHGFEQIVSRFDRMLTRVNRERDERNRGLVVLAESSYRENLEILARTIWSRGHRWGQVHNIADIPYFAPARNTRLLQCADFVTNAIFSRYETGHTRQFDKLGPLFDQDDGQLHGLVHLSRRPRDCLCPACLTRRDRPGNQP